MFYRGKYFDLFEAAIQMLLINNGLTCVNDIDAISFRCCHYVFDDRKWQDCIHSAISTKEAIERINAACFAQGGLEYIQLGSLLELNSILREGDILGPVAANAVFRDMESECFSGQTKYLYCCGKLEGFYKWHCAYEFPFILKTTEELWNESGLCIIRLYPLSRLYKQIDTMAIMRDSVQYQIDTNVAGVEILSDQLDDTLKRKQKIALQLGIYNYLLQTNRYINFLEHTVKHDFPDGEIIFSELYQSINKANYQDFNAYNKQLRLRILEVDKWKV